ncbi:MAG TPA: bifunctional diaminohydroxyphosphoribosylaminopyrimidine deaminase/5-amino-6-(5-phosphoribosylamino)uracil reductase RibD [Firmicutes bacterium]|nr:bifunctional diaminohydroxyphosphoribosylaminopyrimidine deaminase/5-amino-6-(5-phosphoribosylamino)uracil reductase RibD [Bacillota bacterium]
MEGVKVRAENQFSEFDRKMMRKAFCLARKGLGRTFPNPAVGAVLVREGKIVGAGYHGVAGGAHAEAVALAAAGEAARGSTLYVTLEPCCHHGRTPPCSAALIKAGVIRVVAAMPDPNPQVAGDGLKTLAEAGVRVECGLFAEEARRMNEAFVKYITTGRPFITLKAAVSLDGKIAAHTGDSRWITGITARRYVHLLRSWAAGVMVGVGTVLKDDPNLTCRWRAPTRQKESPIAGGMVKPFEFKETYTGGGGILQPVRIVVDSKGRTPLHAKVLKNQETAPTLIAVTEEASGENIERLRQTGARVLIMPSVGGRVNLSALALRLAEEGITSILLEGGGTLNSAAVQAGIVDKLQIFIAPKLIGGASAPTFLEGAGVERMKDAWQVTTTSIRRIGEDFLVTAYLKNTSVFCNFSGGGIKEV